jgi:SAM-dependent methyltransferase
MPAVLDLRSQTQYESGHAAGAYNIPFDELRDRGFEMPSHKTPLVVECDAADVERVDDWFRTRDERCRWNVVSVRAASIEQTGPGVPGRFLFTGCPLLAAMTSHVHAAAAAPGSRALDVGSGSGRDAALLCCRYGFDLVCALDREAKALNRWTRLLDRHQVPPESRVAVEATIRAEGDLTAAAGPLGPFQLVHVARFLKREVLAELASLLAPGGLLLYHTFVEDTPSSTHAVAPGELRRAFSSLEILRDDVGAIDDGRELSFFAARKPA